MLRIQISNEGIAPNQLLKLMHEEYRFIACDADFSWYAFKSRPEFIGEKWRSDDHQMVVSDCFKIKYDGEPSESLHARPEIQSTDTAHNLFSMPQGCHV